MPYVVESLFEVYAVNEDFLAVFCAFFKYMSQCASSWPEPGLFKLPYFNYKDTEHINIVIPVTMIRRPVLGQGPVAIYCTKQSNLLLTSLCRTLKGETCRQRLTAV